MNSYRVEGFLGSIPGRTGDITFSRAGALRDLEVITQVAGMLEGNVEADAHPQGGVKILRIEITLETDPKMIKEITELLKGDPWRQTP